MIHPIKGFGIVNKAEIDVFRELSCFFDDPVDVGNLISDSSAFSKTNMLLEFSEEITPERMKRWNQSENNARLWMWLVMEVKSDAVKNNIG